MKKLVRIVLMGILALSLCGCGGTEQQAVVERAALEEAKAVAISETVGYVQNKHDENFYADESLTELLAELEKGTAAIEAATSIAAVQEATAAFKRRIDAVEPLKAPGKFLYLQDAYDAGYITERDLRQMADLLNNCKTISLSEVKPRVLKAVKELYAENLSWGGDSPGFPEPPEDTDEVSKTLQAGGALPKTDSADSQGYSDAIFELLDVSYYGVYNNCYCVRVDDSYSGGYPDVVLYKKIKGVVFGYSGPFLCLWKI